MELWHDEVGSALARPLDASVFLSQGARVRPADLPTLHGLPPHRRFAPPRPSNPAWLSTPFNPQYTNHPSSGLAFDPYKQPWDSRVSVFPYGAVAHEAASRIQRAWVRYQNRKAHAAMVMQALFRGHRVRVPFKVSRLLSTAAAVRMQSLLRMHLGKKRAYDRWCFVNYDRAAKFQACWRGLNDRRRAARVRAERDRRAATLIQTAARGLIARLEHRVRIASAKRLRLQRLFRSTLVLQRLARGYIGRCRARRRLAWAVVIMDWWRALVRTNLDAARDIQRVTRGFMGRRRVKHLRATAIQTVARRMAARRRVERLKARLRAEEEARSAEEEAAANRSGDAGVEETVDFLKTKRGKERLKQERKAVKAQRKEVAKQRKAMSRVQVRRAEAADAFHLFDTDASEAIDRDEFKAIMEELCMPYVRACCWCVLLVSSAPSRGARSVVPGYAGVQVHGGQSACRVRPHRR